MSMYRWTGIRRRFGFVVVGSILPALAAAQADTIVPTIDASVMMMLFRYHLAKYAPGISKRRT